MRTSQDLIYLIDKLLESSSSTKIKMPNNSICNTDVEYVYDFWCNLVESLDDEWFDDNYWKEQGE